MLLIYSNENGDPYLAMRASEMRPEPRHDTNSASPLTMPRQGETQCVA